MPLSIRLKPAVSWLCNKMATAMQGLSLYSFREGFESQAYYSLVVFSPLDFDISQIGQDLRG